MKALLARIRHIRCRPPIDDPTSENDGDIIQGDVLRDASAAPTFI